MKTNRKYALALVAAVPFAFQLQVAYAQASSEPVTTSPKVHVFYADTSETVFSETLSGIHLSPAKKGTFELKFDQELKENAVLEVTNTAGQKVYQKPVSIAQNKKSWNYNVGKLKPDTYLVEVKTSDTTYWTKFKISK